MRKDSVIEWEDIQDDFYRMEQMSCKPSFKKIPKDYITDENRSVKWNREQVEKNHKEYHNEVAKLNTAKNKARNDIYQDIYAKIRYEIGVNISDKTARAIFDNAYNKANGSGFHEIRMELGELIELLKLTVEDIKDVKKQ